MALTQVLDTVELLESILFALPTKDLIFAQRVNKHFQGVIKQSKKLERALFFEPVNAAPLTRKESRKYERGAWT